MWRRAAWAAIILFGVIAPACASFEEPGPLCAVQDAFVLAHKLREAMATELKGMRIGGRDKIVEVDGGYFGGYVKPANHKENRRDRRVVANQNGKRRVVVVMRERDGRTLPAVFPSESSALAFIAARALPGTSLMADEAASWNDLHGRFPVSRIDHSKLYSDGSGVYTNGAEEFFSRMRRAEIGHHHHIAGAYLVRYAQESAWREDHRRMDNNGWQVNRVATLAMAAATSVDWCGYWQRHIKA
jgi:ISXO2-like transposase domain